MRPRPRLPSALLAPLCSLALLAASGCGGDAPADEGAELTAVATTTQVADLVRNVGGERVAVHRLLDPNADPHGYEPRPSDAAAIAEADIVLRSGGEVDEWLGDLVANAGGDAETVELIESVRTVGGDGHDHGEGHDDHGHGEEDHDEGGDDHAHDEDGERPADDDPHWWHDPRNALRAVAAIDRALADADPAGAAEYRESAAAYSRRLRALDRYVAACIERIPPAKRRLVTTHGSLGYYSERYGLTVVGTVIPSLSTAAQPSARDTQELVEQIERADVEAVFPESSLNPKLERAVAREADVEVGRALWADTLGPEGSDGETYIGSIEANTAAIVEGLTGGAERCRPPA